MKIRWIRRSAGPPTYLGLAMMLAFSAPVAGQYPTDLPHDREAPQKVYDGRFDDLGATHADLLDVLAIVNAMRTMGCQLETMEGTGLTAGEFLALSRRIASSSSDAGLALSPLGRVHPTYANTAFWLTRMGAETCSHPVTQQLLKNAVRYMDLYDRGLIETKAEVEPEEPGETPAVPCPSPDGADVAVRDSIVRDSTAPPPGFERNPVEELPAPDSAPCDEDDHPDIEDLKEQGPRFTPHTTPPILANESRVKQALEDHLPSELKSQGIGGTAQVWLLVDRSGRVADVRVNQSSGHPELDQAAIEVAQVMEFTPAKNGDVILAVWFMRPITFQ